MKVCPYCDSELSDTAKKCKFCGERVIKKENELDLKGKNIKNSNGEKIETNKHGNTDSPNPRKILLACVGGILLLFIILIITSIVCSSLI